MKKAIVLFLFVLLLFGCDAVEDMKGMFEKQKLIQKVIKDKYGWVPQVGWNMRNGVLTHVSVIFRTSDVRDQRVSTLEKAVIDAVSGTFKSKPKVIYIQIAAEP